MGWMYYNYGVYVYNSHDIFVKKITKKHINHHVLLSFQVDVNRASFLSFIKNNQVMIISYTKISVSP